MWSVKKVIAVSVAVLCWDAEVATAARAHFAGKQPYERQTRPLTEAERAKELVFRVFKRRIKCVHTRERHRNTSRWRVRSTQEAVKKNESWKTAGLNDSLNRYHSYLSASTGSSFDARKAGTRPLMTPTTSNTKVETISVIEEICR